MKAICLLAAAGGALVLAGAANAAEVEIEHAVARVIVIPENRTDIAVEITQGSSSLPPLQVRRRGADVEIHGGLRRRIGSCSGGDPASGQPGDGARVRVRGHGDIALADAPLIVLRTPMDVEVNAGGGVFGAIGRGATAVDLGHAGCGAWTIANVDGDLSIALSGSGDIRAGTARDARFRVAGSGDVRTGAVSSLNVAISGSGNINVAAVDGDVAARIAGSGDVLVRGGRAPSVSVAIAGSGDFRFDGVAGDVSASIAGSGDVRVAEATGAVNRRVAGAGNVIIGR